MRVEVIRAFGNYSKGFMLDVPGVYGDHLISSGLVRRVDETAAVAAPETATRKRRMRQRADHASA